MTDTSVRDSLKSKIPTIPLLVDISLLVAAVFFGGRAIEQLETLASRVSKLEQSQAAAIESAARDAKAISPEADRRLSIVETHIKASELAAQDYRVELRSRLQSIDEKLDKLEDRLNGR